MATRSRSRWLAALYWLMTTIYVLVVGLAVTATWLLFTLRNDNATQNKPFAANNEGSAAYSFAELKELEKQGLPKAASLDGDGLRVILRAYMNPYSYALAVGGKGDPVSGTLILYSRQTAPAPPIIVKHFKMPRANYEKLQQKLDILATLYWGEGVIWMCGSGIAFERFRGNVVIAGVGNASYDPYYRPIANALYPLIRKITAPELEIYSNWASTPERRPTSGAGC